MAWRSTFRSRDLSSNLEAMPPAGGARSQAVYSVTSENTGEIIDRKEIKHTERTNNEKRDYGKTKEGALPGVLKDGIWQPKVFGWRPKAVVVVVGGRD
ncbi:uncharacterized protein J3R85_010637 [Psidium guajava]|nr:uncharacterized protein J3R85_010637 [Psidium guajava]